MSLRAERVHKRFGQFAALDDINLEIEQGELIALLGPSGCGKTTLLRSFAGLEQPDSGRIYIDHEDQTVVHPRERRVGFVFQHYALFRHMSVFENVAFGLRVMARKQRPSKDEIAQRVHELLALVQLDNQSHKYPHQMSGGQRQRVALARSLIVNPRVLLLDEPFGALDANVRRDLRRWLRRLQKEIDVTTILVTHDQEEALEVADRIILMNEGRVEQTGTPEEIYTKPANAFVYSFIGNVNVFHGRLHDGAFVPHAAAAPAVSESASGSAGDAGSTRGPGSTESRSTGEEVGQTPGEDSGSGRGALTEAYVRPHDIRVRRERRSDRDIAGTVQGVSFAGSRVRVEVTPEHGGLIEVSVPFDEFQAERYAKGEQVYVTPDNFMVFLGEGI